MSKNLFTLFLGIIVIGLCSQVTKAENADYFTSEQYLINHGHSKEITRLVNMQKARMNNEELPVSNEGHTKKFIKNMLIDPDPTRSTNDFGANTIEP